MNSHKKTTTKVIDLVKQKLEKDSTGHGYYHALRVRNLSLLLLKSEGGDKKVVELAAWLHDIAVPLGRKDHHEKGAKLSKEILTNLYVEKPIVNKVGNCILKHRYSTHYKLNSIEEKIIQDADNLDALGATIIPRIFTHCGVNQIPIHDPLIKPSQSRYLKTGRSSTGINHIYEKLFNIPQKLNLKTSRKIAKGRVKFLKSFVSQYLAEFQGKK